eukprot:TRINITY_DN19255_c0_g1_i1.p3 TRINITY_DN19255_c0_g1~~TRINITY_DN19255_c0_g1_i1.p3  ORF type:complete len:110 (-),score=13.23 TRINITY_DN19255_c0_g1_i1:321-650(-)
MRISAWYVGSPLCLWGPSFTSAVQFSTGSPRAATAEAGMLTRIGDRRDGVGDLDNGSRALAGFLAAGDDGDRRRGDGERGRRRDGDPRRRDGDRRRVERERDRRARLDL